MKDNIMWNKKKSFIFFILSYNTSKILILLENINAFQKIINFIIY